MSDPHGRFLAWLLDGGQGDPPRDLAVHAALCATCMDWVAAHDALHRIDVGRAPLPPLHPSAVTRPSALHQAVRFAAAAASMLLVAAAIVLGASQILAGRAGNEPGPTGGVLAASGSPEPSASAASGHTGTPGQGLTQPPPAASP